MQTGATSHNIVGPNNVRCCWPTMLSPLSPFAWAFEENLTSNQYAYRVGCNCTDAAIDIQNNYFKALDDKDCTCVRIFAMDFLQAFDNVKHSLLAKKLKSLNTDLSIVNRCLSFLKDRCQRLVYSGTIATC